MSPASASHPQRKRSLDSPSIRPPASSPTTMPIGIAQSMNIGGPRLDRGEGLAQLRDVALDVADDQALGDLADPKVAARRMAAQARSVGLVQRPESPCNAARFHVDATEQLARREHAIPADDPHSEVV